MPFEDQCEATDDEYLAIYSHWTKEKVEVQPRIIEKAPKKKVSIKDPLRTSKEKVSNEIKVDDAQMNNMNFGDLKMDMMMITQNEELSIFEAAKTPDR